MSKLYQIEEEDLANLERLVPELAAAGLYNPKTLNTRAKVVARKVKDILSNVRWNYGPPEEVIIIPAGDVPPTGPAPSGGEAEWNPGPLT